MSSPAKKRKLNNGAKQPALPSRGLEYFFAKQQKNSADGAGGQTTSGTASYQVADEELARKLQAEWDREERGGAQNNDYQPKSEVDTTGPDSCPSAGDKEKVSGVEDSSGSSSNILKTHQLGSSETKKTLSLSSAAATEDHSSASIPLDESPLTFDPSRYISQLQASWSADGGDASYALLTRCFVLVNGTTSRIKIVDTLVNCVRLLIEADPSSLLPAVWLATNAISPPYVSMELGLGGSAISKALKNVCGLDNRSLKAIYDRLGDPGDVAFEAKKKQSFTLRKPKPLTIKGVYQSLVKIATSVGQGSGEAKQRIVDRLLQDARGGEESRYIVRTLCQHVSQVMDL